MALWGPSCGTKADLILLPGPALSSCQDEYSVCSIAMSLHSIEYLFFALFLGQSPYLIIVLQIQTKKKIRQEWSLLVTSSVLYFKDNFGIYKGSEIVAWHCAGTSVCRDCLSSKENVCKSACLSKLLQKHFFPLQGYVPVLP